jgi:hypothetical protein
VSEFVVDVVVVSDVVVVVGDVNGDVVGTTETRRGRQGRVDHDIEERHTKKATSRWPFAIELS